MVLMPATLTTPRITGHCSNCGTRVAWDSNWEVWVDPDTEGVACIDVEDDGEPIYDVHFVEPGEEDTSDFDEPDTDDFGWDD